MPRTLNLALRWMAASLALLATFALAADPPKLVEPHRSPVDLVVGPDETWLVTANSTSNTLSLVNIADGVRLSELPVGKRPAALAMLPDGKHILVSCSEAQSVVLVEVDRGALREVAKIEAIGEPRGLAVDKAGKLAYVGLNATGQVGVIDLAERKLVATIDVGMWPRTLALTPDDKKLAVGLSGEGSVAVVDTEKRSVIFKEKFFGLNVGQMQTSGDGEKVYFPWAIYRSNPISVSNIQRGWVLGSRLGRVSLKESTRREAITLDKQGEAVADGHGLALTSDESHVVMSAGGSQEILIFRRADLPFLQFGDPDHIDPALLKDKERFTRINTGGRPLNLRILRDNKTVLVANYLFDAIQVVDLAEKKVVREMHLGGPKEPSPERRGEAIFYDGKRSLDQWYSCHTCHYEGGTNAEPMDTFNDGTAYTFKTILPLYKLNETAPYTWHGWQKELPAAMHKSMTDTMRGKDPTDRDVADMIAYLSTLDAPVNPQRANDAPLSAAAQRGEKVFNGETAGCANCHSGPRFTDGDNHEVGLRTSSDRYPDFNTPSLIGVYRKPRLLHDGRARSLEQLLTGPHNPAKVTKKGELTDDDRKDLIEYLKTL